MPPIGRDAAVRAMSPTRRQSQFIAEAIRAYIAEQHRQALRDRLMAGYQANADVGSALAAEWEIEKDIYPSSRFHLRAVKPRCLEL